MTGRFISGQEFQITERDGPERPEGGGRSRFVVRVG